MVVVVVVGSLGKVTAILHSSHGVPISIPIPTCSSYLYSMLGILDAALLEEFFRDSHHFPFLGVQLQTCSKGGVLGGEGKGGEGRGGEGRGGEGRGGEGR